MTNQQKIQKTGVDLEMDSPSLLNNIITSQPHLHNINCPHSFNLSLYCFWPWVIYCLKLNHAFFPIDNLFKMRCYQMKNALENTVCMYCSYCVREDTVETVAQHLGANKTKKNILLLWCGKTSEEGMLQRCSPSQPGSTEQQRRVKIRVCGCEK